MRIRIPGFGFALAAASAAFGTGCGTTANVKVAHAEAAPAPPVAPGAPTPAASLMRAQADGESGAAGGGEAPAPAPTPASPQGTGGEVASASPGVAVAPRREMLDIEAHVNVQVTRVKAAVRTLHQLSERVGGVITSERIDASGRHSAAHLTLRVPSSATQGLLQKLDELGTVTDQNVTARDIGKDYFDANLRLSSLETTLRRYEEILTRADKVEEILRIEQELGRLRAEIEQVKGNLRWLSDRAQRSTLHVHLSEQAPQIAATEQPEPKFYPGLRAAALFDVGKLSEQTYAGGGLSLRASRSVSVDLDLLKRFGSDERGPDALLATLGGELYSDLLGGGERRHLNPYLGWRVGYARFDSDNQALIGATLGLELYKSRWFGVDAEARNYLIFGGPRGLHYGLEPAISASVAF
jgi:hypothetical protein